MSSFEDIELAYTKYAKTGSWADVNYGLIYTCNAGWVDLGHLNPTNSRMHIGASNLWLQVDREGPNVLREVCDLSHGDLNIAYEAAKQWVHGCYDDPYFRFSDGRGGYRVHYRQDHAGYPLKPGVGGHYVVKQDLLDGLKKSVALAIFMDVSHRFESMQRFMGMGDLITDSGYSQEDLVSNLIGFYIGIGDIGKSEAIAACHPVSRETAEAIWMKHGAVGDNKNLQPNPVLRDTHRVDDVAKMCTDDCVGQPRRLPNVFRRVMPAEHGVHYVRISKDGFAAFH